MGPTQPSVRQEWSSRRFRYVPRAKNEKSVVGRTVVGRGCAALAWSSGPVARPLRAGVGRGHLGRGYVGLRAETQMPENDAEFLEAAGAGWADRADAEAKPRRNQRVIRFCGRREERFEKVAALAAEPLQPVANELPLGESREISGADALIRNRGHIAWVYPEGSAIAPGFATFSTRRGAALAFAA